MNTMARLLGNELWGIKAGYEQIPPMCAAESHCKIEELQYIFRHQRDARQNKPV